MQRETFYIGNAEEETVQRFLKKDDDPFTAGFGNEKGWSVFVDRIAASAYREMKWGSAAKGFATVLKKTNVIKAKSFDEFKSEFEKASSIAKRYKIKINETKLMQKVIYETNESVLHELALHCAGRLFHEYFITLIKFIGRKLVPDRVYRLIEKYDLNYVSVYVDREGRGGKVEGFFFREAEKEKEKIKQLYDELKSHKLKLKLGYTRKEYPVEFGLDDIKVLKI